MPGWNKRPGVGAHSPQWRTTIRPRILNRDNHQCTWITRGQRCTATATDVDRIIPRSQGGSEQDDNLRSLCKPHHNTKSSAEGGRAKRRTNKYQLNRAQEPHPGIIPEPKQPPHQRRRGGHHQHKGTPYTP